MNAFIAITDREWFDSLRSIPDLEEVNFWQPSGKSQFGAIAPGELFLFKLHSPNNFVVGGGFYAHSSLLPVSLAWEAFQEKNGAQSLLEMKSRVEKYRRDQHGSNEDYTVGCIILEQPFFLPERAWIPIPSDWSSNIVRGKTYDLTRDPGLTLWNALQQNLTIPMSIDPLPQGRGRPSIVFPRLGQGSFRVVVTDAYNRRCSITLERTLPALDAAHIRPFAESGPNSVSNGILLRRDLHALFDRGYLTITPALSVEVSRRIRDEFENGRDYYRLHGGSINLPSNARYHPSPEFLEWHNLNSYRG